MSHPDSLVIKSYTQWNLEFKIKNKRWRWQSYTVKSSCQVKQTEIF